MNGREVGRIVERLTRAACDVATTDEARFQLITRLVQRFLPELLRLAPLAGAPTEPLVAGARCLVDGVLCDPHDVLAVEESYTTDLGDIVGPLVWALVAAVHARVHGRVEPRDVQEVVGATLECMWLTADPCYREVIAWDGLPQASGTARVREEERRLLAIIERFRNANGIAGEVEPGLEFARIDVIPPE